MDFFSDLAVIANSELIKNGYDAPVAPAEVVVRTYLSVLHRSISTCKRQVLESTKLQIPAHLRSGYEEIKRKTEVGESLIPHQTRKLDDPEEGDPLLNDWDIHHLHLGTQVLPDGYIKRTGPLLYARVTNDTLYAIQVYEHGAWSRQEMIRILHDNWPDSIRNFRFKGVLGLAAKLSDQDIGNLRNAHIQTSVQIDDTVYAPLGGGLTCTGDSVRVIRASMDLRRICSELEQNIHEIIGSRLDSENGFSLTREGNKAVVANTSTGKRIFECNWFLRDLK